MLQLSNCLKKLKCMSHTYSSVAWHNHSNVKVQSDKTYMLWFAHNDMLYSNKQHIDSGKSMINYSVITILYVTSFVWRMPIFVHWFKNATSHSPNVRVTKQTYHAQHWLVPWEENKKKNKKTLSFYFSVSGPGITQLHMIELSSFQGNILVTE